MKKLALIISLIAVLAIGIGATLAYFHDEESAKNVFTTAGEDGKDDGVDIDLEEPEWDPEKGKGIIPGDIIPKDPTIINNEDSVYARIIVTLAEKDGTVITDPARAAKIISMLYYSVPAKTTKMSSTELAALPRVNSDFTLDTTRSSSGVYYYNYSANNGVLAHGESKTLFSGVVVPTNWDQTDADIIGNFDILVDAEAIQSKNFANAAEAMTGLDAQLAP